MEQENIITTMLALIERPAFCVHDRTITHANQSARQMMLTPGLEITSLLGSNERSYSEFSGGNLSLTVTVASTAFAAQVTRVCDRDIFVLNSDNSELRAIALAAQHLRNPLNNILAITDSLQNTPDSQAVGHLQKGLHQLHRIISNMSDSYRYQQRSAVRMETTNITSVFAECIETISTYLSACGIHLQYTGLAKTVLCLADRELLERAVYNLFSNAAKFSAPGSTLAASLQQNGNVLSFMLSDQTFPSDDHASAFNRYLREPGIEDSRNGIGLGMALVRAAAACHGGTVLIDHTEEHGTRITMTISVTQNPQSMVRSHIQLPVSDYTGNRERALLELSEILPANV